MTACMKILFISFLSIVFLVSCGIEHRGHAISKFTGDYRYHNGIAEFFDCSDRLKYYVAKSGVHEKIKDEYLALKLKDFDDAFVKVEGYVKNEELMDGIATVDVFVVTKFLSIDPTRGCSRANRVGH